MTTPDTPTAAPPGAHATARRRAWRGLAIAIVLLLVAAGALLALAYAARSEAGTRWLLGLVPGLRVDGVRGSLIGPQVLVPLDDGRLGLGRWQGIFFCEFDGPRERNVFVTTLA